MKRITHKTAVDAAKNANLSEAARALLTPALTPAAYLDALVGAEHWVDALTFLSHALPRRESVWWACQCIKAAAAVAGPKETAALQAAEKWASAATESNRRAAHAAAEAATFETPAGCCALAAFLSEGSLGPPTVAPIPPEPHLTGRAVSGAVLIAAVRSEPEKAIEKYQQFVELGRAIGDGVQRIPEPR